MALVPLSLPPGTVASAGLATLQAGMGLRGCLRRGCMHGDVPPMLGCAMGSRPPYGDEQVDDGLPRVGGDRVACIMAVVIAHGAVSYA